MGYYDGSTVTALWKYAQHFARSDNFYGSTFGPSVPGHLNLISGQIHGAIPSNIKGVVNGTVGISNPDPVRDDCSPSFLPSSGAISMVGKNIGDLLNSKNITWGWFSAGFKPSIRTPEGKWICTFTNHTSFGGWNSHSRCFSWVPWWYTARDNSEMSIPTCI
jgi:phospholipase C